MTIADLHCDLLLYLTEKEGRSFENPESRCSFPQLQRGGVFLQTLAIFTETGSHSVLSAEKQVSLFQDLPKLSSGRFVHFKGTVDEKQADKVYILAAIENASGLCSETESLETAFIRFDEYRKRVGKILYISPTWHFANRFGGGNRTMEGLTREGELLLEYLDGQSIAIDLSHSSDWLAYDMINYIDKKNLDVTPIASHSNFREQINQPRNLPDDLACEIIKRKGIIGLNFVRAFVGEDLPSSFVRQMAHARALGGLDYYSFGADFFYEVDLPVNYPGAPYFDERFGNASCYPEVIDYLRVFFSKEEVEKIAFQNMIEFINRKSS